MRSLPGSGVATARISNARLSPSLRIGVGQMVGRTVAPMLWFFVKIAVERLRVLVGGEHLDVLLVGLAEVDVDELAHIEAQPVRAVRRRLDRLLAGTGHHVLE